MLSYLFNFDGHVLKHWAVCCLYILKRAAVNNYFNYQLICRLFSQLIYWLCIPQNVKKVWKNAHLNLSALNVTSSNCFFCPNNSPKYKDSSFILIKNTEKQQNLTFNRLNQQFFLLFLFCGWIIEIFGVINVIIPYSCRKLWRLKICDKTADNQL